MLSLRAFCSALFVSDLLLGTMSVPMTSVTRGGGKGPTVAS